MNLEWQSYKPGNYRSIPMCAPIQILTKELHLASKTLWNLFNYIPMKYIGTMLKIIYNQPTIVQHKHFISHHLCDFNFCWGKLIAHISQVDNLFGILNSIVRPAHIRWVRNLHGFLRHANFVTLKKTHSVF